MTSKMVTIIMYHYVRPIKESRYPEIKGLERQHFKGQLDYLCRHYNPISMETFLSADPDRDDLPPRPVLLSFDDGFLDHYLHVFPILIDRGLTGAFFPPAEPVISRKVLDVHKIHFLLASVPDKADIVAKMEQLIDAARGRGETRPKDEYRNQYWQASRFDPPEVIYLKRMLQKALPQDLRVEILDKLFNRFVTVDESAWAEELYLNVDQLRVMSDNGMHLGSHGAKHFWLSQLSREEQACDIDSSLCLFDLIGLPRKGFTFCYPYGDYNKDTLDILRQRGCAAAFTAKGGLIDFSTDERLTLDRLDTNDFPLEATAKPNRWTKFVL